MCLTRSGSFENARKSIGLCENARTGQCFIALDPGHYSDNTFAGKIEDLCVAISQQEGARLPGSRRIANRHRLEVDGVEVEDLLLDKIRLS